MTKPAGFHVRHDFQPHLTYELLTLLRASLDGQTEDQLQQAAQDRGYNLRERKDYRKLLQSLDELGILAIPRKPLKLSKIGYSIANTVAYYPHLLPEFIHFLYYTWWDQDDNKRFSWSYRAVCDTLWNSAPYTIDRDRLVNLVIQEATQVFGFDGISFSTSSVAGILNWLTELQPQCITRQGKQQIFSRRGYCPVELFALAINHIYQHENTNGALMVLTPELREKVCKICLLSSEAFETMLEQTEVCFNSLHVHRERGERVGVTDFSWDKIEA